MVVSGDKFVDKRGELRFFNEFNMAEIVRFYEVAPVDTMTIRAWQAHQYEKKWFYCLSGAFVVNLVKFEPSSTTQPHVEPQKIILTANEPKILEINGGVANGFQALKKNSRLQIFSNFTLKESKLDDYKYPIETWSFLS